MINRKIIVGMLVCLVLVVSVFAGCTTADSPEETVAANNDSGGEGVAAEEGEGALKIAAVMKNRSNPYYHKMEEGFLQAASDLGIVVEVFAMESEADLDKQMQLCNDLLIKDYDGMVLVPINGAAFGPFIKEANERNFPIVNIDTQLTEESMEEVGATYVTYVGSDDYSAGVLAAAHLAQAVGGEGKLAILEGSAGSSTAEMRKQGFVDEIERLNGEGAALEIVASQPANWDTNQAYEVFQNVIQANQDLDGLFASNDLMAIGAYNAAQAAGKNEQISIISVDMIPDAQELILSGDLLASISQAPDQMALIGVEKLVDYIGGQTVDAEYRTESVIYYKSDLE